MHRNRSERSVKDRVLSRALKIAAAFRIPGARARLAKCPGWPNCK